MIEVEVEQVIPNPQTGQPPFEPNAYNGMNRWLVRAHETRDPACKHQLYFLTKTATYNVGDTFPFTFRKGPPQIHDGAEYAYAKKERADQQPTGQAPSGYKPPAQTRTDSAGFVQPSDPQAFEDYGHALDRATAARFYGLIDVLGNEDVSNVGAAAILHEAGLNARTQCIEAQKKGWKL